jgi:hypothetical protein
MGALRHIVPPSCHTQSGARAQAGNPAAQAPARPAPTLGDALAVAAHLDLLHARGLGEGEARVEKGPAGVGGISGGSQGVWQAPGARLLRKTVACASCGSVARRAVRFEAPRASPRPPAHLHRAGGAAAGAVAGVQLHLVLGLGAGVGAGVGTGGGEGGPVVSVRASQAPCRRTPTGGPARRRPGRRAPTWMQEQTEHHSTSATQSSSCAASLISSLPVMQAASQQMQARY